MENKITNEKSIDAIQFGPNKIEGENSIAIYALNEAIRWFNQAAKIVNQSVFNQEAYVMMLYSVELTIKSLLSKEGCDILNEKYKIHKIRELYNYLPKRLTDEIKDSIIIQTIDIPDRDGNPTRYLISFEDYINEINNDFVKLRYEYEKFDCDMLIFIPTKFIIDLAKSLILIACRELNLEVETVVVKHFCNTTV